MVSANKLAFVLVMLAASANACGDAVESPRGGAAGGTLGQGGKTQNEAGMAGNDLSPGGEAGQASWTGAGGAAGHMGGGFAGAAGSNGGSFGVAGSAGDSANAGSAGLSGAASAGAAGAGDVNAPILCARLETPQVSSDRVAYAHLAAVANDCRVSGLLNALTPATLPAALNRLNTFNMQLWGCLADEPSEFELDFGASELSLAEAELLIGLYLDQATNYLQLGARERKRLSDKLYVLAAGAITHPTQDWLHSKCGVAGQGGGGGVSGVGGGSSGGGSSGGGSSGGTAGGSTSSGGTVSGVEGGNAGASGASGSAAILSAGVEGGPL
ncbi:MAG: hypothetical protein ACOY0T_08170 [Myxococcota bacterium]